MTKNWGDPAQGVSLFSLKNNLKPLEQFSSLFLNEWKIAALGVIEPDFLIFHFTLMTSSQNCQKLQAFGYPGGGVKGAIFERHTY